MEGFDPRVQAFGLDGVSEGAIGLGSLQRPSGLAIHQRSLFVADLLFGVVCFDERDGLVASIARTATSETDEYWPNGVDDLGLPTRPKMSVGLLNSPHGIAVDPEGRVFVAEWFIGGRVVRLDPT